MAPAMKGAIAAVAAGVVLDVSDSKLALGGMSWSAPTVIGVSVAGASLASQPGRFRSQSFGPWIDCLGHHRPGD